MRGQLMATVATQLKDLRQQLEKLQIEVAGRKFIGSMIVWDEQNESSVNHIPEGFGGLIVHLTRDVSPPLGTTRGISRSQLELLKCQLKNELSI